MRGRAIGARLIVVFLGLGAVSPVLYFGAQLICGLMTDGYSFRHGDGAIGAGMFVAPFAVAFALQDQTRLRPILGLSIAAFVAGGAILANGNAAIAGLGQRLLAGAVFPTLALMCGLQLRDRRRSYCAGIGVP